MAILKQKTLSNGAVGEYWRITYIHIDRQNLRITGNIALFKDKATSDGGGPPLGAMKSFTFPFTMSEFLASTNAISFIYSKIVAYAASEISYDINGDPIDPPRPRDADLAGGESTP